MNDTSPGRDTAIRDVVVLTALAALFLFPSFPLRELWTPDEPRYMEVAREMVETGDYLVPHLSGEVYPDKPPMFFWLAAGFYQLGFGYNAGRTVAALAIIGLVLVTYGLARRIMPRPGPILSALIVLTTFLILDTKPGVIDPLLAFFAVAAIACGHTALQPGTRRRAAWWLACYALAGLGVLTKGPVGFAVPGLVLLAYGLVNRKRVRGGGWLHAAGAALLVAVVCAWLVPAMIQGGDAYAHEIGLDQTLNRMGRSATHAHGPHHYVMLYPAVFFPWSFVFSLAFVAAVREWRRSREPGPQLVVLWFAVIFVFFSFISGKRPGYLMPAVPAVGLAVGWYLSRGLRDGFPWPRWHRWLAGITLGVFAVLGAVIAGVMLALPKVLEYATKEGKACPLGAGGMLSVGGRVAGALVGVLLVVLALYGIAAARKGKPLRGILSIVGSVLILSLSFDLLVVPRLNRLKSPKPFCEAIQPYLAKADRIYLLGSDMSGGYNLYTGIVAIPVLRDEQSAHDALAARVRVAVIAARRKQGLFDGRQESCWVPVSRSVGSRQMDLILNWDPEADAPADPGVRPR